MPIKSDENLSNQVIQLPKIFIEKYMKNAPHSFSVIYIYAISLCNSNNLDSSNSSIAKDLNILETDVLNAFKYWEKEGIVTLKDDDVVLLDLNNIKPNNINTYFNDDFSKKTIKKEKPDYSIEEINAYAKNSPDVDAIFKSAQQHLGRLISYDDMATIFSFHDWLNLPLEVIEIMIAYCSENGNRAIRYLEKVAIDWAENEINTPEKALSRIKNYSNKYKVYTKTLNLNRMLSPVEEELFKKWIEEFKMSEEIIIYALEKTILTTGNISLNYADTVITNWHNKKITTIEGAEEESAEYLKNNKQKTYSKDTNYTKNNIYVAKKNKFSNFEQRKWDFKEIEQNEQDFIEKSIAERKD